MRNDDDAYVTTRLALHSVAEHVLSAGLHAANGRIGLRRSDGGFGTPPFPSPHGDRRLLVAGTDLVVSDDRGERRARLTTIRAAADLAEVEPGAPADVYTPATQLEPDAPLVIDAGAAARLAGWYALVDDALEALRGEHRDADPAIVQLWPEHFDLATTFVEVNYGGSPGDAEHALPYLYVGPWNPPERDGKFWNEPFGASLPVDEVRDAADALAFFRDGYARVIAL